ncbi:DNA polymerase III subunit delta [Chlamydiota bacterium]
MQKKETNSLDGIIREIKEAKSSPVYLIYGDEEFLVTEASQKIVTELTCGSDPLFGKEVYSGPHFQIRDIQAAVNTLPFFGSRKVVFIKDSRFFSSPNTQEEVFINELKEHGVPEGIIIVFVNETVKKTTVLYKFIQERGRILEFGSFGNENRQTLSALFRVSQKRLAQYNKQISRVNFDYLIQYTGLNLRQIIDELEKLCIYSGQEQKEITREAIDQLVPKSRQAVLFKLADTVFNKKLSESLLILNDLLGQGENPIGIVITLTQNIRFLLQLSTLFMSFESSEIQSLSYYNAQKITNWITQLPEEITRLFPDKKNVSIIKQHPYRIFLKITALKQFGFPELCDLYKHITDAYLSLVTSMKDPRILLELLIIRICTKRNNKNDTNNKQNSFSRISC